MKLLDEWQVGTSEPRKRQEFWFSESIKSVQTGDYAGSVNKIDKAIAASPKKPEPWLLKGYAIYHLGRFDESLQMFNHVLKLDPGCIKALFLRGLAFIALHRYEDAIRSCDLGLAMSPDNPEGWYICGLGFSRIEMYEAAIQCYSRAIDVFPGYSDAISGKKQAEKFYLRQTEVMNEIQRNLENDPLNVTLLNRMAKILSAEGRFDESLRVYSGVLEIDPENRTAIRGYDSTEKASRRWAGLLSEDYGKQKNAPGRMKAQDKQPQVETLSDVPRYEEVEDLIGNPDMGADVPTDQVFESRVQKNISFAASSTPLNQMQTDPGPSIVSATELVENGEYSRAIEMLQRRIYRDPADTEAVFVLVETYEKAGMFSDALSACDHALQTDPENAILWGKRGKMLMKSGRYDAADVAYSRSLGLNSENAEILAERGDLYRKLGQYREAEQSYIRSLDLKPESPRIWYHLGKTLAMLKHYQEAIDACETAITLDSGFVEALTYKGFLLSKIQRYNEALDVFNNVLTIDPQSRDALRIMKSLKGKV
jgi:tetratricopeptide (TPR) repeat protein